MPSWRKWRRAATKFWRKCGGDGASGTQFHFCPASRTSAAIAIRRGLARDGGPEAPASRTFCVNGCGEQLSVVCHSEEPSDEESASGKREKKADSSGKSG